MPKKCILITGAAGLLGRALTRTFERDAFFHVQANDQSELNITDEQQVGAEFKRMCPDIVINCAAFTRVDDCEKQEALAMAVNGQGAGDLAKHAAVIGAKLIHISTDYVFDGRTTTPYLEDSPTGHSANLSAYGRSKLLGERLVQQHHPQALIVRSCWLYGQDGPCFPQTILRMAKEGKPLRIVSDQRGCPTYTADLAEAIYKLALTEVSGIVHVANRGDCTWFEFTQEIVRRSGLSVPVEPITTEQLSRPARRPNYSVLSTSKYEGITGVAMRNWRDAFAVFLASVRS